MEKSLREANSHSISQEIPFMETKGLLPYSQQLPLVPTPSQMNPVHNLLL